MLKSPPLVATLSDSMRMSPCSWGDIFTWPLRGDRISGLRHLRKELFALRPVQLKMTVAEDFQFSHLGCTSSCGWRSRESTPFFLLQKPNLHKRSYATLASGLDAGG